MNPPDTATRSLRDYGEMLWRRRWIIVATVAVCVAAATAASYSRTPLYRATASLTFQKQSDITQAMMGTAYVSPLDIERELATAASLIPSREIRARAARILSEDANQAGLGAAVTAVAQPDTNLLRVTATGPDAERSAQVANAYANAFATWKKEQTITQLDLAEKWIEGKLESYDTPEERQLPAYYSLQGRLQDLRVIRSMTTGNYQFTEEAAAPSVPFTPNHTRDILIGVFIGLFAGVVIAFVVEQVDVRVRTQDALAAALELPVIGRIPRFRHEGGEAGLVVLDDPDGVGAEAFRMLRGSLDFVSVDAKVSSMLVTSCTQSEGKTSTVCNLAVTLARAGKKVVVVEADLRRPKVHRYFKLENDVGLSSVVAGRATLPDALRPIPIPVAESAVGASRGESRHTVETRSDLLKVLTSGPLPPNPGEIVTSQKIQTIIGQLAKIGDLVLIDSPPFFAVGDSAALAAKVDGIVIVAKLEHVTKPMLKEAKEYLAALPCRKLGIVATNVNLEGGISYRYKYYRNYASETAAPPTQTSSPPPAAAPSVPGK